MQFLVLGYDDSDDGALDRRMAVRTAHLETAKQQLEMGNWLYAAAILDDSGKMIGSAITCEFDSIEDMKTQWLDSEPYVTGNVWKEIKIQRAQVAPFCLNRNK